MHNRLHAHWQGVHPEISCSLSALQSLPCRIGAQRWGPSEGLAALLTQPLPVHLWEWNHWGTSQAVLHSCTQLSNSHSRNVSWRPGCSSLAECLLGPHGFPTWSPPSPGHCDYDGVYEGEWESPWGMLWLLSLKQDGPCWVSGTSFCALVLRLALPLCSLPEWFWSHPVRPALYSWDQLPGGSRKETGQNQGWDWSSYL